MKLIKKINYKLTSLVLFLLVIACAVAIFIAYKPVYQPSFVVMGDVEDILKVDSMKDQPTYSTQREGTLYRCMKLEDLINKAKPYASAYSVVLKGDDGLLASVNGQQLDGMFITYTAKFGWEMFNKNHPPSSNIKRLTQIIVVSEGEQIEHSVNVITSQAKIASYTPGQFMMMDCGFAPIFQGESRREEDGKSYQVSVFTERRYKNLLDIAPDAREVLVMGEEGQYTYDSSPGQIALIGNRQHYVYSNGKKMMKDVRGILVNPPSSSIMDVYPETTNNIAGEKRVLVIVLDGFGYRSYQQSIRNGAAPYLASLPAAKQATSVYKPVTNAGLAAILTGQPPSRNGVFNRDLHNLNCPDIFSVVEKACKKSIYLEGDINILNTSVPAQLHADQNGDKSTDDEVYASALSAVQSDANFVLVHFHGIDDMGHTYGPLSDQTMKKISTIDGYVKELCTRFCGKVLITADHGMHETDKGGSHGLFCTDDIIVPYLSYYKES